MSLLTGHDAWLHLFHVRGLGPIGFNALLEAFGTAEAICAAPPRQLATVVSRQLAAAIAGDDSRAARQAVADWLAADAARSLLTRLDADYPLALAQSPAAPPLLFLHGRRELLSRPLFAIVGSRHASAQGIRDAGRFARALADTGYTIVSGLAAGIDAAAHDGAVDTPAATVAVIGTGIDRVYPACNRPLARRIAGHGLIVSEFPLGTPPLAAHFPRRNRIIAGLGAGCLVVEAGLRSGSLITARQAAEAGREVFAIPGSIHSPLSRGCHALIRDGARLTESLDDILAELPPLPALPPVAGPAAAPESEFAAGDARLLAALGFDPVDADTLAQRTGLTVEGVLAMLLPLELAGRVAPLPGGRYQRVV